MAAAEGRIRVIGVVGLVRGTWMTLLFLNFLRIFRGMLWDLCSVKFLNFWDFGILIFFIFSRVLKRN